MLHLDDSFSHIALELNILGRFAAALAFGAIVGAERQLRDKPAGMRTHMLVAALSCLLFSMVDPILAHYAGRTESIRMDPIRMVQALMTGIGFLVAGTIIRRRSESIGGLTTAASILMASGIGVACALSQFLVGFVASVATFLTLYLRTGGKD